MAERPRTAHSDRSDADLDEIVAILKATHCDYCLSPIDVVRPNVAWAYSKDEIIFMLDRAGRKFADIVFAWYCTGCDNFSIVGTDFEEQWFDSDDDAMECPTCLATAAHFLDPAQAALKDRKQYLDFKKVHGADAMLSGEAMHCTECDAVEFFPATAPDSLTT